jgi:hypothetical protein
VEGVREKALEGGFDGYMEKPIDTNELIEFIQRII